MPGSKDGKKLFEAAVGGKGEEVERLLKMGVKPEDYKTDVRRFVPLPPPLSVLRLQSPTPDCNTIEPPSVGLNPFLSAFLSHPTNSPRALNTDGVAHRASLLQGGWGSHCCSWLQCQPVTHSRSLTVF
jgi:hypothetical protein